MASEPYRVDFAGENDGVSLEEGDMECCGQISEEVENANHVAAAKRPHEDNSSEEEWQTVSRRKSVRRSSQTAIQQKTDVIITCVAELPKQFGLARLLKDNKLKGITRVKYFNPRKMLMTFEDEELADKFIQCHALAELGWRCQKTTEVGLSYGVIKNVDLELDDENIMKELSCDIEIVSAKRLQRKNTDESSEEYWVKAESVRLGFKGSVLPTCVFIHGLRIKVDPFIFPVTQCSRCWKYGHSLRMCPSRKIVCPKCTKEHDNCKTTAYICVNCTGEHMALQKICPVYRKERRIRELMAEFNCTYRKALTLYVPPSPVPERTSSPDRESQLLSTPAQVLVSDNTHVIRDTLDGVNSNPVESEIRSYASCVAQGQGQGGKKERKPRSTRPHTPAPVSAPSQAPAPVPMEAEACASTEQSDQSGTYFLRENAEGVTNSGDRRKEFTFVRLLIKLKNIILSNESFQNKITQAVVSCAEWLISKFGSSMSISSLIATFMNVVVNEHG